MIRINYLHFAFLLMVACGQSTQKIEEPRPQKLITAGGTISEIIHELGHSDRIIATDITSTYPSFLQDLPSIGYRNQIKAEGIFALDPDDLYIEEGYLTDVVLSQLKSSGLPVHVYKKPGNVKESKELIRALGEHFDSKARAEGIISIMEADLYKLQSNPSKNATAIFIMARGPETLFLAGEETFAYTLFGLAGLQPAATGFKDFIPLTPEALIKFNPEHIILFESGLKSLGGMDGISKINGISQTKAFKNGNIHAFDGQYLSGFGPRLGKAALELQAISNNP